MEEKFAELKNHLVQRITYYIQYLTILIMSKKESLEKIYKLINPMHNEEPINNDLEFLINAMGNYFDSRELENFVNFLKDEND